MPNCENRRRIEKPVIIHLGRNVYFACTFFKLEENETFVFERDLVYVFGETEDGVTEKLKEKLTGKVCETDFEAIF